jgi:hypothetical protein
LTSRAYPNNPNWYGRTLLELAEENEHSNFLKKLLTPKSAVEENNSPVRFLPVIPAQAAHNR